VEGPRVIQPRANIGRNEQCWCDSGLKYKRCHLQQEERAASEREKARLEGMRLRTVGESRTNRRTAAVLLLAAALRG
jgi:hypothetical protein